MHMSLPTHSTCVMVGEMMGGQSVPLGVGVPRSLSAPCAMGLHHPRCWKETYPGKEAQTILKKLSHFNHLKNPFSMALLPCCTRSGGEKYLHLKRISHFSSNRSSTASMLAQLWKWKKSRNSVQNLFVNTKSVQNQKLIQFNSTVIS